MKGKYIRHLNTLKENKFAQEFLVFKELYFLGFIYYFLYMATSLSSACITFFVIILFESVSVLIIFFPKVKSLLLNK